MKKMKLKCNPLTAGMRVAGKLLSVVLLACFVLTGCDTPSTKQKLAETRQLNDSLMLMTLQQQNEIAELVGMFGEVSSKLDEINGAISVQNAEDNHDLQSQRERLMNRLQNIQQRIQEKQTALDKLQKQYSAALGQNAELKKTIDRMQREINDYIAQIGEYKNQLRQKNEQIAQLNMDLSSAQDSIEAVNSQNQDHRTVLAAQDRMLNSGFYIIATKKELKDMGLIKKGVFTAAKLKPSTFDTSVFRQIDIREVTEIPLGSKDAKILSAMPEGSYELVKDYDRTLKIVITDPASFWSITRYLVVMI